MTTTKFQCPRADPGRKGRSVGASNLSLAKNLEVGAIHASIAKAVGRHAEDDGQRDGVLRPSGALHLHLQVSAISKATYVPDDLGIIGLALKPSEAYPFSSVLYDKFWIHSALSTTSTQYANVDPCNIR